MQQGKNNLQIRLLLTMKEMMVLVVVVGERHEAERSSEDVDG